jgi:hypothetical protein
VAQRLVVIGDGGIVDRCNAEGPLDLESIVGLRKLPEAAEQALGGAPSEQQGPARFDPQGGAREDRQLALLLASGDHRQKVLLAGARGDAVSGDRADQAAGRGGRAERGAELHEALVEIAGGVGGGQRGHELAGAGPQGTLAGGGLDVVGDVEDTGEDARDVAIDERRAFAERDRCDRPGGVRTDARDLAEVGGARGQGTGDAVGDGLGAGVEVARARVVAEARPRGEDIVEWSIGERAHRRKPRHPAFPVRDDRLDARLLQHDLADPDRVRIPRAPPGQVAAVTRVVRDDRRRDGRVFHAALVARQRGAQASCRGAAS